MTDFLTKAWGKLFEQSFVIIFCVMVMSALGALHYQQDEKKEVRIDKLENQIVVIQAERYSCKNDFIDCQKEVLRLTKIIEDFREKLRNKR